MTFRTDHAAGLAFVLFGITVLLLSGDLPSGRLAMPGAGFLPKVVASLMIFLGVLVLVRGGDSPRFASIDWSDLRHAALIVVITSIGITLYLQIGFVLTMGFLLLALLIVAERRNAVRAIVFSLVVVIVAFGLFDRLLNAPLPKGPFGF
jgi:hypothetical protein